MKQKELGTNKIYYYMKIRLFFNDFNTKIIKAVYNNNNNTGNNIIIIIIDIFKHAL
jgi:hypothetical protein